MKTDDLVKPLGTICANFAALETAIAYLIWRLLPAEQPIGQMVTAQLSFQRMLDLLSSLFLFKIDNPVLRQELSDLLKEAQAVEQERNKVIHSVWWSAQVGVPETDHFLRSKVTARRDKGLDMRIPVKTAT